MCHTPRDVRDRVTICDTGLVHEKQSTNLTSLFLQLSRLDQSEKSISLLISFASYHLRYNNNTQKEMALEVSEIQSLHPFKGSQGQRPCGEMPNRSI